MAARKSSDPFAKVRDATLAHRAKHGCGAWPYGNGALLSVLAAAVDADEPDGDARELAHEREIVAGLARQVLLAARLTDLALEARAAVAHEPLSRPFGTPGELRADRGIPAPTKEKAPRGDGALSGVLQGGEICMYASRLCGVGRKPQVPRGRLNRVEAVSAIMAAPTPTKKTVAPA